MHAAILHKSKKILGLFKKSPKAIFVCETNPDTLVVLITF